MNRVTLLGSAAAAACAAGVVLTLHSAWAFPAEARSLRQKAAALKELQALERGQAETRAAVAMFGRLPHREPAPLGDLVRAVLPGAPHDLRPRDTRPASEGWTVRTVEVSFDRLKLDELGRLLDRAEAQAGDPAGQRPPWRLAECSITASEQAPGHGRVVLVFEGLEKAGGVR